VHMNRTNPFYPYIAGFHEMIMRTDASLIADQPYPTYYFEQLKSTLDYTLHIYADLLHQTINQTAINKSECHLIDYGAGNGLLGLFAKYAGFKAVMINERDPEFLSFSKKLAAIHHIDIDYFSCHDLLEDANIFLDFKPDAIVATDVIEHIYDLDLFFERCKWLNPNLVSGFTTASNPMHPIKSRKLMSLQRKDEYTGNSGPFEPHLPFFEIRQSIINALLPSLDQHSLYEWTKRTRGLHRNDIELAVIHWKKTGNMPLTIQHPTNTCHPETGSWTERLLPISVYQSIAEKSGFQCCVQPGYYNVYHTYIKKIISHTLNKAIQLTGKRWAPFLFLFYKSK
jgi:hypothetical protein